MSERVTEADYVEFCKTANLQHWDLCSEWAFDPVLLQIRIDRAIQGGWKQISPPYWNGYQTRYEVRLARWRRQHTDRQQTER